MKGKQGERGIRGERGATGERGERGRMGMRGPRGPRIEHAEVLAVVDSELGEVRKHFIKQITQTTRIEQKLDEIHNLLKQLIEDGEGSSTS